MGSPPATSSLETERAHSGFSASYICHLLTYVDTYPLTYSPVTHTGQGRRQLYSQRCTIDQRAVNSGVQQGCHFGHPCSRVPVHTTREHGPCRRPVNADSMYRAQIGTFRCTPTRRTPGKKPVPRHRVRSGCGRSPEFDPGVRAADTRVDGAAVWPWNPVPSTCRLISSL